MTASRETATNADDRLAAALEEANLPTLLMVLVHLTGDERWLEPPYRPRRARGLDDNDDGGLPGDVQREIRGAALEAITAHREGRLTPTDLAAGDVTRMLSAALGEEVEERYGELLLEEMGIADRDVPVETAPDPEDFRVLVIGSGLSGLCIAIKLEQAGVPYTILEKNPDVGGTWLENRYPGCGVDTPSHLYSYSFAMNTKWDRYFAKREQVHAYLERLADEHGIRRRVQFETEVVRATYRQAEAVWEVEVRRADGSSDVVQANAVVTAVGQVNRPAIPDIPGLGDFAGTTIHTAAWDPALDLRGKRVAVVGTGASSMQLVPAIAGEAAEVLVFQRSPQWALPHPNYHREVSPAVKHLLDEVPYYAAWYRLRVFWNFGDRLHASLMIDPEWPHFERSINATNERHRVFLTQYIEEQLGDRQDLLEACLPTYPPYGKRPLIDNRWYETVRRDDVRLISEPVTRVREHAVVDASGEEHPVDVIVLATGFRTLQFLWPMEFVGRHGRTLRETWGEEDARAYLGIAMPGFPNLFFLNGPNTSAGHGGSAVLAAEFQTRYIMQLLARMLDDGVRSVDVRQGVFDAYQAEVDEALSRSIWTHPGMTTYYRNSAGRVVTTSPWKYIDYWTRLRHADMDDFHLEARERAAA